jgi:hypothetical protein
MPDIEELLAYIQLLETFIAALIKHIETLGQELDYCWDNFS